MEDGTKPLKYIELEPTHDEDEDGRDSNGPQSAVPGAQETATLVPGSTSNDELPQSEPDDNAIRRIDPKSARRCSDLYQLTDRIIGKSGITMTAELVARVAIMVSLDLFIFAPVG
jgi:hypothetical protein